MTRERCADGCLRRGDRLWASAPPVRHWLLVEQPGPWGPQQVPDSALPGEVKDALLRQAGEVGARLLLIRRPGRARAGPRRWGLADSRPGRERVRWADFTDPADLTALDLPALLDAPAEPTGPVYLVCAHGNHDACCAIRGRPVAAALDRVRPGRVWECSHVGGDRFAGNVVVLPHGFYYGQVTPDAAAALADGHEAGLLDLPRLRGRSVFAAPAQAAQQFARERAGERRLDSFAPRSVRRVAHEVWDVHLAGPEGPVTARVRAVFERGDTPLTCTATVPAAVRHFELVHFG